MLYLKTKKFDMLIMYYTDNEIIEYRYSHECCILNRLSLSSNNLCRGEFLCIFELFYENHEYSYLTYTILSCPDKINCFRHDDVWTNIACIILGILNVYNFQNENPNNVYVI